MQINDLGEFGLIERLKAAVNYPGPGLIAGIGDDCAVLEKSDTKLLLATCDVQIEGVHFLRQNSTADLIGRRAVAVNLSDIAAMGGQPQFLLISLALPGTTPVEFVDDLYQGMRQEAEEFGVSIVGGNTALSPTALILDLTVLGEVERDRVLYRKGARVGDTIMVTGQLGASAAGLALLLNPGLVYDAPGSDLLKAIHRLPRPRVREGRALSASGLVTAMLDLSDGLAGDLGHLCAASGVGALLQAGALPVTTESKAVAALAGRSWLDYALQGGEDYELLFTVRPGTEQQVTDLITQCGNTTATFIGTITEQTTGLQLQQSDGTLQPFKPEAFDHFGGK